MIKKILKCQKGFTTMQWLVLSFLMTGAALLVLKGIKAPLKDTHDSAVKTIESITGGGF